MNRTKQSRIIFTLAAVLFAFCAVMAMADEFSDLMIRGATYGDKRDYDRAIVDFTAALRVKPNYTDAMVNLMEARQRFGDGPLR